MIIITNEMLLNAFGRERVPFCKDLFMYSLKSLIEKEEYGKDITAITQYESQRDAQRYWDCWLDSTIANKEAEEYFKGEDNMNKYETLLKKYEALYKDFEVYKQVTEDIADKGTYVRNEALAELLECKKKYEELNDKFKDYRDFASERYDELVKENVALKDERGNLVNEASYLHDVIEKRQEKCRRLTSENDTLLKECNRLKKERDDLVKEVYYCHEVINEKNNKCKEKMEKIKQRDKQITKLIDEKNALHTLYTETAKERDNFEKRLDHINAMSNLEWEFEEVKVEDTLSATPYDELVDFCVNRRDSCIGCPKEIACDGINPNIRPAKWTEEQKEDYNELMSGKEDK